MKQRIKISGMVMLALVVFISVGYLSKKRLDGSNMETALEHSLKHVDSQYQCPMHPNIVKGEEGNCPICGMTLVPVEQDKLTKRKEKKLLYWVAPMDPNYRRDKPGKSPMGMDLEPVYEEFDDAGDSDEKGPVVKISS